MDLQSAWRLAEGKHWREDRRPTLRQQIALLVEAALMMALEAFDGETMRRLTALLVTLLLATPGRAQQLKLPAEISGDTPLVVIAADTDCETLEWVVMDQGFSLIPSGLLRDTRTAILVPGRRTMTGRYRVLAYGAKANVPSKPAICTIVVTELPPVPPGPTPVPPLPPTPPGPTPPVPPVPPGPTPTPPPIPGSGLRALIVYESSELSKLPAGQLAVIYSKTVRDYLNAHCPLGTDGKTHEWRIWDKDLNGYADSQRWGDALKRPRTATPWLIISTGDDGKAHYEGPLPATVDDMIAILKKYGG